MIQIQWNSDAKDSFVRFGVDDFGLCWLGCHQHTHTCRPSSDGIQVELVMKRIRKVKGFLAGREDNFINPPAYRKGYNLLGSFL